MREGGREERRVGEREEKRGRERREEREGRREREGKTDTLRDKQVETETRGEGGENLLEEQTARGRQADRRPGVLRRWPVTLEAVFPPSPPSCAARSPTDRHRRAHVCTRAAASPPPAPTVRAREDGLPGM